MIIALQYIHGIGPARAEKIVNAIGHVKIYFPTPARDFFSQLNEPVAEALGPAFVQTLRAHGEFAERIVTAHDMRASGPDSYVSAVLADWREFYLDQVDMRIKGTWTGSQDFLLRRPWRNSGQLECVYRQAFPACVSDPQRCRPCANKLCIRHAGTCS